MNASSAPSAPASPIGDDAIESSANTAAPPSDPPQPKRLLSIDALRGFDMLWIIGATWVFERAHKWIDAPWTKWLNHHMRHARWDEGITFHDLIMPLFMFITGCSMVFSFRKRLASQSKLQIYRHVLVRVAILWLLGMIYQGHLLDFKWANLDFYSNTLQAIAIGYLGCSLMLLIRPLWGQVALVAGLLVGYWALMHFVPVPGGAAGELTQAGNLAIWIDKRLFGQHIGNDTYAWILPSMTFIVTVALGCFSGRILLHRDWTQHRKLAWLIGYGLAMLAAGYLWSLHDPIIKRIWTSSFTLVSGGWCILLLAGFYLLFDVWGLRRCALPMVAIGANAIFAYMVFSYNHFFHAQNTARQFIYGFENLLGLSPEAFNFVLALAGLALTWLILWVMYRHRILFKI